MQTHNIRYGFATNSSSSHSIVLLNDGERASNSLLCSGQSYGGELFTAASEKAKREYLGQQLKQAFVQVNRMGAFEAAIIASKWAGVKVLPGGEIDHQSEIAFPCVKNGDKLIVRSDFFNDLLKYVLRPNVVIVGGNDNDAKRHSLLKKGTVFSPGFYESNIRGRYDKRGKFWSLFDYNNGDRVHISFVKGANAEKSEVPELVDVKITEYCTQNCDYCYQKSTPTGKHANFDKLTTIAIALSQLETFEVALGGGEPTNHPEFLDIIKDFSHYGVKPNFSTRNEKWIVENWNEIKGIVGGIGLSADHPYELVDKLSRLRDLDKLNLTVQLVVGSCPDRQLQKMIEICKVFDVGVLLLGWKKVGRGSKGPKYKFNLEEVLDKFNGGELISWSGPLVSFDTILVQEMHEWLSKNANPLCFASREGAHSMYIDAVKWAMGRSSYESKFVPINSNSYECMKLEKEIKGFFGTI